MASRVNSQTRNDYKARKASVIRRSELNTAAEIRGMTKGKYKYEDGNNIARTQPHSHAHILERRKKRKKRITVRESAESARARQKRNREALHTWSSCTGEVHGMEFGMLASDIFS